MAEHEPTFTRFVEHNEWEGATWSFWLQIPGNVEALSTLSEIIRPLEDQYELFLHLVEPENVVDILVDYADEDYMPTHNKVTGKLIIPNPFDVDALYKGGIQDFFHESR